MREYLKYSLRQNGIAICLQWSDTSLKVMLDGWYSNFHSMRNIAKGYFGERRLNRGQLIDIGCDAVRYVLRNPTQKEVVLKKLAEMQKNGIIVNQETHTRAFINFTSCEEVVPKR